MLTWRCRCERSGSQRPDFGLRCSSLGLLPSVGAALPGEHRAFEACRPRRRTGRAEAGVAVSSSALGQPGTLEVEEREDEQLVPEDVTPVGLPMPAACRHADVQVCAVRRDGLQQVEDVQVQDRLGPLVGAVHLDVESVPGAGARRARGVPAAPRSSAALAIARPASSPALGDRAVARGVERDDLLDRHRLRPAVPRR